MACAENAEDFDIHGIFAGAEVTDDPAIIRVQPDGLSDSIHLRQNYQPSI